MHDRNHVPLEFIVFARQARNPDLPSAATKLESATISVPHSRFAVPNKQRAILCLALFALTLVFYNPIVHDGFVVLDDVPYIISNPPVRAGLTWATVKWSFTTFHAGNWHPLTWLSHALDCQVFGLNPAGHHYVSLLFHAANAVLLFLLLEEATALTWPSLLVAALFASHPVNVESVAWAAERKNVLSMFFFLLAMWAYGRYARRGGVGRYATVALCFVLGLMAKPQVITLPFVLLLWDYWPLQRMFAKADSARVDGRSLTFLVAEKVPLFAVALAGAVVTMAAQRSGGSVRTFAQVSLLARLENALVSYARYLANLLWPRHLAPLYPHPGSSIPVSQIALSAAVLLGLTAVVLRWRQRRYLAVGWFWFLGVLVPMIGIVTVGEQAMADRYLYVPIIGSLISLVWAAWEISEEKRISKLRLAALAAVIVTALGGLSYHQLGYWRNGETLWRYTLTVTQANYMAHDNLAMVLDKQGRVEEAIPEFEAAEALHRYPLPQVLSMGIYLQRYGHVPDALDMYQKVLSRSTDPQLRARAWSQIGSANAQVKNYDQAKLSYENALQLNPMDPSALVGSGMLAERNGNSGEAAAQLARAVNVEPGQVGYVLLAHALRRDGRQSEAESAEELGRKISPDLSQAEKTASETEIFFGCTSPAIPAPKAPSQVQSHSQSKAR
jgi:tetratricopeptide (TPR) repeat protein